MGVKFANDKPIFLQIAEIIRGDIVCGKFKASEKLPSVREFALQYSVNPNTVQKALQILEDEGLILTDRTNGKFVNEKIEVIKIQREKTIKCEIDLFFDKMKNLGLSIEEIKDLIIQKGE